MAAKAKKVQQVPVRPGKPARSNLFLFSGDFWAHTLLRVLVAALVVSGGWLALAMARDKAVQLKDFQISPSNLEFISKPDWLGGPLEEKLKNFGWGDKKISLLDSAAARKIAAALSANPMVKRVNKVERTLPNRMRAEVELREPVAFVLRGRKYYLVDAEGTRLPGAYASRSATGLDRLLIVSVRTSPPPAGKVWDDPAVVEAAKLAAFLKDHKDLVKEARITAIDSSNIGGRRSARDSEIVLLTAYHTKIYWGRGISSANATELSAKAKIQNLKSVIDQAGGLSDKEYVDIRLANPVYVLRGYNIGGA